MKIDRIMKCLPNLKQELIDEIEECASINYYASKDYIIKQGQYIRQLPIVLEGNVKVFSQEDTMQFLLYYIQAGEPCIFSFAHLLTDSPIEFSAVAEQDCVLLMLPIKEVKQWLTKYPSFARLLLQSYEKHYGDLLATTKQIICYGLEGRLMDYLKTRSKNEKSTLLQITHLEIASDLGTSREVITRIMKKLGQDGKIAQEGRMINLF